MLKNAFINATREEFGFRKVGEGWISETMVFNVVRRLLPNDLIERHHRPAWLGGLELDVFVPRLQLGIEYQGQQHFHPIEAWGGEMALEALQKRDQTKRRLCAKAGVKLLEIHYTDPITESFISERLRAAGML